LIDPPGLLAAAPSLQHGLGKIEGNGEAQARGQEFRPVRCKPLQKLAPVGRIEVLGRSDASVRGVIAAMEMPRSVPQARLCGSMVRRYKSRC